MPPLLIAIEPGPPHVLHGGAAGPTLQHGVGHWTEAIERFAHNWTGDTLLIGNQAPSDMVGVKRFRSTATILRDARRPLFTLMIPSRITRIVDPLFAGPLGSRLVRQDWERASHPALLQVLEEEVAKNPETTIFIPTGIAMTVETVIRNIERLKAAAGGGSKLKFRIRFSSQGHERRGLHPSYFGLQLKRWHERAGDVDLRFGIEVESMAQRYSEVSGLDVAWVPWPNEATNCAPLTTPPSPAAPHIYIYASRREQGTGNAERIVQGLKAALPSGARYTVQVGSKGSQHFPEVVKRLKETDGVTFSGSGLPPEQLHALFADASAIILPYELRRYKGRGSALMWAALDHGIPMIAPVGTGFGDDIARHGIGYAYRHLDEIPQLVLRSIAEASDLKAAISRYQVRRTEAVAAYLYT